VICTYYVTKGHFVAQAISYKLPIAEVWVHFQGSSYAICCGQVAQEQVFLKALCVSHASFHSTSAPHSPAIEVCYNRAVWGPTNRGLVTSLPLLLHHKFCGRSFNDGVSRAVCLCSLLAFPAAAILRVPWWWRQQDPLDIFHTWCHIPVDSSVHSYHFENHKSDGRERSFQGSFWYNIWALVVEDLGNWKKALSGLTWFQLRFHISLLGLLASVTLINIREW